jgi:hypothetical protein
MQRDFLNILCGAVAMLGLWLGHDGEPCLGISAGIVALALLHLGGPR